MESSCYGYFLRIYPQRMAGCHWQPRRNNPHSSNGVVKQTCRHYLRHIRNAINQNDGKGTKRSVRSELQDHRTTTDTPGRFQRGTQITIIQSGVVCIPAERVEGAGIRTHHTRTPCVCWSCWRMSIVMHETIDVLGCNQPEPDTRICLHAKAIDDDGNANNITITASDTDIAVSFWR